MATDLNQADDEGFAKIETDHYHGLIHWRGNFQSENLNLHAPGRDLDDFDQIDGLAIDLPSHGLSDSWKDSAPTNWEPWQAVIDAVAQALGAARVKYPETPEGDPERLYPDLSPDRFGRYLGTAWQITRARHFFTPWYEANAEHAVDFDVEDIKPAMLAKDHLALLNARAAKAYHIALQGR